MLGNNAVIAGTFPKVNGFAATTANIHNDLFKATGVVGMSKVGAALEELNKQAEKREELFNKFIPSSVVKTALSFGNKWICTP